MRSLQVTLRSESVDADSAYDKISRFEKYPDLVDEVRSVIVRGERDGRPLESDWEVHFRSGPLRWSEVDYFQPELRRIVFEQTAGDFEVFRGSWQVDAVGATGSQVTFETTFDFGIPSLAGVLEPIATKVLKEGISIVVYRLLGGVTVIDDPATAAAIATRLASNLAVSGALTA